VPFDELGGAVRSSGVLMSLVVPDVLEEGCTTRQALERLASKWRVLLIYALLAGPQRNAELRRRVAGICGCRKPCPRRSCCTVVFMDDAAEAVTSMDVEARDHSRIGDRFWERV
jgi:hypothetical protein